MIRILICAMLAVGVFAAIPMEASAQKKNVQITQKWNGSVEDDKLPKPEFITNSKGLETIWKAWKVKGDVPKVDFAKNIIVAVYSPGSRLSITGAKLDDTGNLEVLAISTADFGPGFRYVLGVVSRDGVKSVNKKNLPK